MAYMGFSLRSGQDLNRGFPKSRPSGGNKYIFDYNIIKKYNIVLAEYELEGDCSKYIKKVYTKCIEENEQKRKNPGVTNFMIVFEFSQRPKDGKVVIL